MEIILPQKENNEERPRLVNPHNITIIGANGAGKSRFGQEIERQYPGQTFRLSALNTESSALQNRGDQEEDNSISAQYNRLKEGSFNPTSTIITEFQKLQYLLQREEFVTLTRYKESMKSGENPTLSLTRLDRTQAIWEKIFPQSRMICNDGELQMLSADDPNPYNAIRMSQGEQVVFYLIAATLFAVPDAIIIIEEPEIHLHRSIMNQLWDDIEQSRPDCTFVYLTHDLEFAASRGGGVRIWVKSYNAVRETWDYELIENQETFPEEIYLELLGSRKPILFIEGADNASIDIKLYPYIFPDYMVKPLGGCSKVIETTKAFAEMKGFHHLESKGIVDRDRRTLHEINYLKERNIFVPDVAEVENLLMLEEVVRTVARRMLQDENLVFEEVRKNVIALFDKDLDSQALLHTRHRLRRKIEYMIDRRLSTVEELAHHIETLTHDIDTHALYNAICQEFKEYIANGDYNSILRVYNQKGMLPQSKITHLCGLANKEKYLSFVLSILKENRDDARVIRTAIQHCFGID